MKVARQFSEEIEVGGELRESPAANHRKKKVGTSSTGACATWQWLDYWMNLSSVYLSSELILIDTQTVYRPGVL
jgi:hypothetical protein